MAGPPAWPGSGLYVLDVTGLVRPGANSVEVRVTNLLINRLLGMAPPDYGALRKQFGERFPDPQEWKVAKAAVRLRTARTGKPRAVRPVEIQVARGGVVARSAVRRASASLDERRSR